MSTIKFIITNIKATMIIYADIIGISTKYTALINNDPMPGHWKTVSVIIEKAINVPMLIPVIVITGINPFLSACL